MRKKKKSKWGVVQEYVTVGWVFLCLVTQTWEIAGWLYYRLYQPETEIGFAPIISQGHVENEPDSEYVIDKKDYIGKCETKDVQAAVDVYITDKLPKGRNGEMRTRDGDIPVIILSSNPMDINYTNLIAHETSHFIDAVMASKGLIGTEARAYLQGYYTNCVTDLVNSSQFIPKK